MDIRYSRGLDELYLMHWLKNPANLVYLPCSGDEEIKNFSRSWMYYSSKKAGLSLVEHDRCLGMGVLILMPYDKVKHHAVLQIVMDPKINDMTYQVLLIKNMIHLAKNYFQLEALYIEHIGPEKALDVFKEYGFKEYAVQKGYIEGPYPDKILLECFL